MHFSTLLIVAVGFLNAVLAAPAPVEVATTVGSVVTDKGRTYEMVDTDGYIKAFDQQVDNGRYPRPVTYQVNAGHCIFYT